MKCIYLELSLQIELLAGEVPVHQLPHPFDFLIDVLDYMFVTLRSQKKFKNDQINL